MNIRIVRFTEYQMTTLGKMMIDGKPEFSTLELAWANNVHNFSCIPAGSYKCERVKSPKFGVTFQVMNVPDRSEILLHPLNTIEETKGCIGIGYNFGMLNGLPAIYESRKAFNRFMDRMNDRQEFDLTIVSATS